MQMYVYAEEVFLINFLADWLICSFVCRLRNCENHMPRCFLGALTGGIYAVVNLYINCGIPGKMIVCFIMGMIIGGKNPADAVRCFAYILTGSFICAGGTVALTCMQESFCASEHFRTDFISVVAGSLIAMIIFGKCIAPMKREKEIKSCTMHARIIFNGRSTDVCLFDDSGNLLRTPGGKSVLILDNSLLGSVVAETGNIPATHNEILEASSDPLHPFYGKTGIIYAYSIGGKHAMMTLRADKLILYTGNTPEISPIYLTFADIGDERFSGIINYRLITKEICNDN